MSTIHAALLFSAGDARSLVARMLEASAYWSPDALSETGSSDRRCQLAKAALFNTERSKRDGAHHDAGAGLHIAANARLDNRDELGRELGLSQSALAAATDSELILLAYRRWGEACPAQLLGDFVFIIHDEPQRRLFCARDHFGIKVLFYAHDARGTLVSNEHNAFFTSHWLPKQVREAWLVERLWGLTPTPFESPCAGVQVLPPAHSMTIDADGVRLQRYWQLVQSDAWQGMDEEALFEELKARLSRAVSRRLDSAYLIGSELSEGLDSNAVAGYAARLLGDVPLYTFSYDCERESAENRHIWQDIYRDIYAMHAMHPNLRPVWQDGAAPTPQDYFEPFFDAFGAVLDITGMHFVRSHLAAGQGVRTLLSGWGGDHCVSAYGDFYESELLSQRRLGAVQRLLSDKHRRGRGTHPIRAWSRLLLKHHAPALFRRLVRHRSRLERARLRDARRHFLKREYRERYHCEEKLERFVAHYQDGRSVQAFEWRELFDIGVEQRLVESELTARLARLEYRYPLLDVELVEMAYNLPGGLKIKDGIERYIFRRLLEGVTTPRIQWRLKADVAHAQSRRQQRKRARLDALREALNGSTLAPRYCDTAALARFVQQASLPSLRGLELLVSLEKRHTPLQD